MDQILHYFPGLSPKQIQQFEALAPLYREWNAKINVISRKDIDRLYEHHVLHSLGIAKVISFTKNTEILDVGTGGGFPGIPLAIFFPEVKFHLIDSIGKKIRVVNDIAASLDLNNVTAEQVRVENYNETFDFIVSRAVADLPKFLSWVKNKIKTHNNNAIDNGILYLKGGDFTEELSGISKKYKIFELSDYFQESYFLTKKVIHIF